MQTQIFDDVKDENPVWLDPEQISKYGSHVTSIFSVNVSDLSQHSFTKLKRLVRYLKGQRQWIQVFKLGDMSSEATVFSDSDCWRKRNDEIVKLGVALAGRHSLKAYTRKQKIIARSSSGAELYAGALGASEAKGVQSMMCDLRSVMKPVLIIDAKAHRTHHSSAWNRQNKTHRRGAFVVARCQIEQVESPPCSVRGQSCGHRDEGAQQ